MLKINKNENFILRFNLFQSDGTTPLLLANCSYIAVTVMQNLQEYATYVYLTDPEITQGASTSQVKVECKTTLGFDVGVVRARVTVRASDGNYPVQTFQQDTIYHDDLVEVTE